MKSEKNKAKNTNHSTKKASSTRKYNSVWRKKQEELGFYGNQKGFSRDQILDFGKELVQWALEGNRDPDYGRLSCREFWIEKGIYYHTPEKWKEKYPEFKILTDQANHIIGNKREKGMLKKELSETATRITLYRYLDEYKEADSYNDERAKIRKDEDAKSGGNITVEIKQMPSTPEVPEKINES